MRVRKLMTVGLAGMLACCAGMRAQEAAQTAPAAATGTAQVATGGTRVHGTITDPDGELIPGATVTLTPSKGPGHSVKTGSDGTYSLSLTPGSYTFVVSMPGFASYSALNVRIPAVAATTLDAKMQVGADTEVVNVDSDAVQLSVDADSNASAQIISGKDLDALSDDPDELSSELSALAGPSAGPNGGQIYVDGFTGGQLPPKSSIREIRINQNPFSAQFDRLGYGRVEVFTKPGTDKIHGSLQMNGNPSQFNSGNPLQAGVYTPPYHTFFVFGSLTGPLTKWASYSIGGSHRDIEDDAFVNTQIYAAAAGAQTVCSPGQAGCIVTPFQQAVYTPQTRTDISPRIDLALGEKNVLTTRFQYVQNDQLSQGLSGGLTLPSAQYNSSSSSFEVQMSDTQTYSSRLINETRFEYERERVSSVPFSTAPQLNVQGLFTSGGSSAQRNSDHQDHFELQNYTSLALKKNFIRMGGRLRTTREAENTQGNTNGSFTYSSVAAYQAGTPSQFAITQVNNNKIGDTYADLGLYAETDWKPRPNLTVSYGLRFETQNHLSDHHDLAPRVSFAYGLGKGTPKTVLRGGFGLFYDRFAQSNILTLQAENGQNETIYTVSGANVLPTCSPNVTPTGTQTRAQAFEAACGASTAAQTTYQADANLRAPYIVQFAAGFDRQLGRIGTLSANYLHSQGVHELASQNIGYNGNPLFTTPTYQYFSEGVFHQNQLILNARIALSKRVSMFGYYTLNSAKGDSSGAGSFLSTPGNIAADYGRTAFDVRSRFFAAGSVSLPHYISFSPFVIAQSGDPYNITLGSDFNGDTIYNDRPLLVPAGTPGAKSIAGCGTFAARGTVAGAPVVQPYNCSGPALFTFNFRLTKTWGFGPSTAPKPQGGQGQPNGPPSGNSPRGSGSQHRGGPDMFGGGGASTGKRFNFALGLQVQNLFNNEDLGEPNAALSSPLFGTYTQLHGGAYTGASALRRIALQASINF